MGSSTLQTLQDPILLTPSAPKILSLTGVQVEGTLAGNIFDWGSNACVELYQNDTILEMYRKARAELRRPWIVDDFEAVRAKLNEMQPNGGGYKKVRHETNRTVRQRLIRVPLRPQESGQTSRSWTNYPTGGPGGDSAGQQRRGRRAGNDPAGTRAGAQGGTRGAGGQLAARAQ
jgi:hypothetical protein